MSSFARNKRDYGGENDAQIKYSPSVISLNIVLSIEWNTPLCIGFIDFKRAFDSIHHSTL